MSRARHLLLLAASLLLVLLAMPARPAAAGNVATGYVWNLRFSFEKNFDGALTIQTGPMQNGVLLEVKETSTTTVPCQRIGAVQFVPGAAVFKGGHLRCQLDLAGALLANHGIVAEAHDSYDTVTARASLVANAPGLAPIFVHPDAAYQIDFSTNALTMRQSLATTQGVINTDATFPGLLGNVLRNYGFVQECAPNGGPCGAEFSAGAAMLGVPIVGGGPVKFSTGPTTVLVGGDGAAAFLGGLDDLIVDPGNTFPEPK